LSIINIQLEKTQISAKTTWTLKEQESCRIDAPQQLNQFCYCPVSTRGVACMWEGAAR